MLSNRHFGKPTNKVLNPNVGKEKKTVQVSAVMVAGREVLVVAVDWTAVQGQTELQNSFAFLRQLFPGKNLVLVARDPLKFGQPAVFFGPAELASLFEGRQMTDFKWTPLEYK
jgi:hypothetical protein